MASAHAVIRCNDHVCDMVSRDRCFAQCVADEALRKVLRLSGNKSGERN